MSIIQIPEEIIISNVSIKHEIPTFATESLSLISRGRGVHRIRGSFDVHIAGFDEKKACTAFLIKLQGRLNTFYSTILHRTPNSQM
jgi:hypothetical protein